MLTASFRSPAQSAMALLIIPLALLLATGCGSGDSSSNKKSIKKAMSVDEALEKGLIDEVEALKQRETNSLHIAINEGYYYRAFELIKEGRDVNRQWDQIEGRTCSPLQRAAGRGNVDMVRLLLDHGADVNQQGKGEVHRFSPLHHAAANGNPDVVKLLLKHGADINAMSDTGKNMGQTPLYMTIAKYPAFETRGGQRAGYVRTVEILVESGADVNATGVLASYRIASGWAKRPKTPLDLLLSDSMASKGRIEGGRELANYLIKHGAITGKELENK